MEEKNIAKGIPNFWLGFYFGFFIGGIITGIVGKYILKW